MDMEVSYKGLVAVVDDSTQWVTVYDQHGLVAGTLTRRRVLSRTGPYWSFANRDGEVIATTMGNAPLVCLMRAYKAL